MYYKCKLKHFKSQKDKTLLKLFFAFFLFSARELIIKFLSVEKTFEENRLPLPRNINKLDRRLKEQWSIAPMKIYPFNVSVCLAFNFYFRKIKCYLKKNWLFNRKYLNLKDQTELNNFFYLYYMCFKVFISLVFLIFWWYFPNNATAFFLHHLLYRMAII